MKRWNWLALAAGCTVVLAGCGGGGDGNQAPAVRFTSMVSFGDSLSDIGTYRVGTVAALGGGMYTVNGVAGATGDNPPPNKNWTELIAAQIGQSAPCPAQTGLDGDAAQGFSVAPTNHVGCYGYAQGGARVTNPVGPGNKRLGGDNVVLGQLTVPVVTQIANHLSAVGGSFGGTELVTVMAGGNDALELLGELGAAATAAGTAAGTAAFGNTLVGLLAADSPNPATAAPAIGLALQTEAARAGSTSTTIVTAAATAAAMAGNPKVMTNATYVPGLAAQAQTAATTAGSAAGQKYANDNGPSLVTKMATAGTELAGYVTVNIVGKGAKYVAVINLPDVSLTPAGKSNDPATQGLIHAMAVAFNNALKIGLGTNTNVRLMDVYTENTNQINNPAQYSLTNVTAQACNTTAPAPNALGSSLVCNGANLNAGDVSHYLFADGVHPTPYGYKLLAQFVAKELILAGWI